MSTRKTRRRPEDAWRSFSYSKLSDLAECPLRFFFRYIRKLTAPLTVDQAVGSCLHYLAYRFFDPKRSFHTPQSASGAWAHHWMGVVNGDFGPNGHQSPPVEINWQNEHERWIWLERGRQILQEFYRINHQRKGTGVGILRERRFRVNIGGYIVNGVIDRVDEYNDGTEIVDYKKSRHQSALLKWSLQPTIYQAAYEQSIRTRLGGKTLRAMWIETLTPKPERQAIPLRTETDFESLVRFMAEASAYIHGVLTGIMPRPEQDIHFDFFDVRDIEERQFKPRLPRGMHCSICPYHHECEEWEKQHPKTSASDAWRERFLIDTRRSFPQQPSLPLEFANSQSAKRTRPPKKT